MQFSKFPERKDWAASTIEPKISHLLMFHPDSLKENYNICAQRSFRNKSDKSQGNPPCQGPLYQKKLMKVLGPISVIDWRYISTFPH